MPDWRTREFIRKSKDCWTTGSSPGRYGLTAGGNLQIRTIMSALTQIAEEREGMHSSTDPDVEAFIDLCAS